MSFSGAQRSIRVAGVGGSFDDLFDVRCPLEVRVRWGLDFDYPALRASAGWGAE